MAGTWLCLSAVAESHCACAGLNLLLELLVMFERSEYATQFHQTYYLQLMREIFVVMTGARSHEVGFTETALRDSSTQS